MRFIGILLVLLSFTSVKAQVSEVYSSTYTGFYRAEDLFEKEQYSAARKEFRLFIDNFKGSKNDPLFIKAQYYEGISALEVYNNDAIDLLEAFNRDYPESIYKNEIFFRIGRYFYQKKDYKKTLQWFESLEPKNVELSNLEEYYFKLGYSNFKEEDFQRAKLAFFEIKDSVSQYGTPSLYYYSHISYMDSSYQTALEGFEKLMKDDRFNKVVPYYITQIYYMQGDYQKVVDFGPGKMDSLKPNEQIEMNHIIGDAYYKLGKYDEAIVFLEKYHDKSNPSRDDEYILGIAYSKSSNCTKAVKYFDKVARVKDTIGQIALYHAGVCYMNLKEFSYARTAFEVASTMDMDKMIQEDALYNYAVLSYKLDINAYDEAVEAFELYLSKYPDSPRKATIYQYLVNVYTSTKNYGRALESLDKLPNKDAKLKAAYQLIAFNRGVELFQKSEFAVAIEAFKKVDDFNMSQDLTARAKYWSAESIYLLIDYTKAIQEFTTFLKLPSTYLSGMRSNAYYNMGYAYLETKDYNNARINFENYLKESNLKDKRLKADAHMRLADEYYRAGGSNNSYNSLAIEQYKKAIELKQGYDDQALYYMAKTYSFLSKKDERLACLQDIVNNYKNSRYMQRAVQEIAETYYNLDNYDKAERYFNQIITDYPNSTYVKDAHHYLGDIAMLRGNYSLAEQKYKYVLSEFNVGDSICKREVNALAELYRKQEQLSKIEDLPRQYACADSVASDVENEYFDLAHKNFVDKKYSQCIVGFDTYLTKYPNGKFKQEAMNSKAEALWQLKREDEAIAIYRITLEGGNDDFTETAATRVAKSLFNADKYEEALPYYKRIEEVSANPDNLNNARIGLMRSHFLIGNFTTSAEYSKKVLNVTQTTQLKLEAEYIKGISLSETGNYSEAKVPLEYVIKNTTKEWASESKYTLALNAFKQNDYTLTETIIRDLLKMKPKYDFWIAKGLLLQTKVLMAKQDYFQAENTVNSVIDNYPIADDGILTEANELYDEIMQLKSQPKMQEKSGVSPTIIEVEENNGN
ncbi:MAG: tetratricopeptide repeat protein [Fluviicola sp.]